MREFVKTFGIIILMFTGIFFYGELKSWFYEYLSEIEIEQDAFPSFIIPDEEVLNIIGLEEREIVRIGSSNTIGMQLPLPVYTFSHYAIVEPIKDEYIVEEIEQDLLV